MSLNKHTILCKMREETYLQLAAVQEEDVDKFTDSVERLEGLITALAQLNASQLGTFDEIGKEILNIRAEINVKLPIWHEKLRREMLKEKNHQRFKATYDEESEQLPPIFFDQRK